VQLAGTATATEPISSRNCERFPRVALSLLAVREFVVAVARPPARTASTSRIDERGAEQPTRLHLCVGSLVREGTLPALVLVLPAPHGAFSHYKGVSYAEWPEDEHE
jgi:hypothetical protein